LAAIGSLVAASSGSSLAIAMVAAATFAPQGICSPLGGLLADRFERRRVFLTTLGAQAVLTSLIAVMVALGVRSAMALSLMVLLQSSAGALGGPSLQAILPDLVDPDELGAAVALGVTSWNSGRIVGPLLATLLVPIGTQWAVAANAASFYVLWIAIVCCRRRFQPSTHAWTSFTGELVAGVRALRRSSGCMAAVLTICVISVTANPFIGIIPATSRALVTRNGGIATDANVSSIVGRLLSAQGIGAILGSLLVANLLRRYRPSIIISTALTSLAAFAALHQYAPTWLLTAMCIFVLGGSMAMLQSVLGTVVQRDASPAHRGRILSWYQGLNGFCYGVGLLIMGWTADHYGLRPTFIAAGLALAIFVVLARRSDVWADAMDGELAVAPEPVVVAALS